MAGSLCTYGSEVWTRLILNLLNQTTNEVLMRINIDSDRPWYLKKCQDCNALKHVREFRRRSLLSGHRAVCKVCEGEPEVEIRPRMRPV